MMNLFNKQKNYSPLEVEKEEYVFYINYLKPGMTVFDIGANVGHVSLLFSKFVQNTGKVYSFEPTPSTFKNLEKILELSSVKNVYPVNKVVSEKKGKAYFHIYPKTHSSWNTLANRPLENYGISIKPEKIKEVETIDLDSFCKENHIQFIDLLKIDVEGAELNVLKGAKEMLQQRKIGACLFEFGQTIYDMGVQPEEILDFLEKKNYSLKNLIEGQPLFPHDNKIASFSMLLALPK